MREVRIQAEELSRLDETLYRLELEEKKDCRPGKWKETVRKQFVNDLLDAVKIAGGHLGLDRSNGRGKLDKAIKLLRPYIVNSQSFGKAGAAPTPEPTMTEQIDTSKRSGAWRGGRWI